MRKSPLLGTHLRLNPLLLLPFMLMLASLHGARAEILLQNDAIAPGTTGHIQTGLVASDIGAAVFELPAGADGFRIKGIRVLFLSPQADALHTFVNVHLYCGIGPNPGLPILTIAGVGLSPDFLNEVEVLLEEWIVHRSDGPFAIGIEYLWTVGGPSDATTGHLVTDSDGCQPGRNLAFDSASQTWLDPCAAGMAGDFAIRVVGDPIASKAPFGDHDGDGDVDMDDFAQFQRCYTGQGRPATAECAAVFDCDRDGDIDQTDFEQFVACASRAGLAADINCGACLPGAACAGAVPTRLAAHGVQQPESNWTGVSVFIPSIRLLAARIQNCPTPAQLISARTAFINAARSIRTDEHEKVTFAINLLRNTWGQSDPEAAACGNFLQNNGYGTFGSGKVSIVPLPQNPRLLIATQPAETEVIIIYEDYLTFRYTVEGLALILYSQWSHIEDPGGGKERLHQQRLNQLRQDHGLEDVVPEMRHGAPEGATN